MDCWTHAVRPSQVLAEVPEHARATLQGVFDSRGVVEDPVIEELTTLLDVDLDGVILALLRIARAYAVVPISGYPVGAAALAVPSVHGPRRLYLGANFEICGGSPTLTVHAEQAATMNAWQHGETGVQVLATSSPPCGYCRQFLNELTTAHTMDVLVPTKKGPPARTPLTDYLPEPFGPDQLDNPRRLMEPGPCSLHIVDGPDDRLAREALQAASMSYAPYTRGHAGAALQLDDGSIWSGPYAENAAHNPTMRPLTAAASFLRLNRPVGAPTRIERAVLVQVPSRASERGTEGAVLARLAPGIELESATAAE